MFLLLWQSVCMYTLDAVSFIISWSAAQQRFINVVVKPLSQVYRRIYLWLFRCLSVLQHTYSIPFGHKKNIRSPVYVWLFFLIHSILSAEASAQPQTHTRASAHTAFEHLFLLGFLTSSPPLPFALSRSVSFCLLSTFSVWFFFHIPFFVTISTFIIQQSFILRIKSHNKYMYEQRERKEEEKNEKRTTERKKIQLKSAWDG